MTKRTLTVLCLAVSAVFLSACQSAAARYKEGAASVTTGILTAEEAKQIALTDAGVTSVTHIRAEYDRDDGVPEYEVEFNTEDREWEYTIQAETGAVLKKDVESRGESSETVALSPSETAMPSVPAQASRITPEEAQAIALEHAEVTVEQVTQLRARYDADDAVPEYEVEFRQGDYEYDYTVHAETGKVLEHDREYDPVRASAPAETKPAVSEQPVSAPAKLSREEARSIALNHAGLKPEQVKGLEVEYDKDDGIPEYAVEFYADGWEYEYEIHAETGKILEHHKESD